MIEPRLRNIQLALAAFGFVGLFLELLLLGHDSRTIQYTPFVLCVAGLASIALVAVRPARWSVLVLRVVGALVVAGALLGMYLHLDFNLAFEREVQFGAPFGQLLGFALRGIAPLLAPGGLALGGMLAATATYHHPALAGSRGTS